VSVGSPAPAVPVLLPGCSAESRYDLVDTIREELDQAEQRRAEQSGDIAGQPDARSLIGTDSRNALDYARYQSTVSGTFGLLERCCAETVPALEGTQQPGARSTVPPATSSPGTTASLVLAHEFGHAMQAPAPAAGAARRDARAAGRLLPRRIVSLGVPAGA
jgi:hypothetical protein